MIKQINTNLQKLFQDADELHRFRLKDFRSDEELGRLKEDHNLEIRRIHALGAEEYRVQLELECQRRKWVFKGQPIDAKRWDVLNREYHNISKGHKSDGQTSTRASERQIWNERYAPSSPVKYEIWRPLEWPESPPDGNERDNVPRKSDAESVAPSPD